MWATIDAVDGTAFAALVSLEDLRRCRAIDVDHTRDIDHVAAAGGRGRRGRRFHLGHPYVKPSRMVEHCFASARHVGMFSAALHRPGA